MLRKENIYLPLERFNHIEFQTVVKFNTLTFKMFSALQGASNYEVLHREMPCCRRISVLVTCVDVTGKPRG